MVVYHAVADPVEIEASPSFVREVFLDFSQMAKWHTSHFKRIELPAGKRGSELRQGDKLKVAVDGMTFPAAVEQNSPTRFEWAGGWKRFIVGNHVFEFQPSKVNAGHTTFVQYEDFSGLITTAFNFSSKPRKAGPGFFAFGRDLKTRCESLSRGN